MAYDSYSAFLTVSKMHTDPAQHYKDTLQNIIDDRFQYASDYKQVSLLDRDDLSATTIGVRLNKIGSVNVEDQIMNDYFRVIFQNFSANIQLGDLLEFNSFRWLVTDVNDLGTPVLTCMIQRCNAKLKFVYTNDDVMPTVTDDIISIDCIADKKTYDIEKDRFYSYPNEEVRVKVPNNSKSRKIRFDTKHGTRFLLGNPVNSYNTKSIDSLSMVRNDLTGTETDNGILLLKLQLEGINTRTDNLTSGVAKQYCYGDIT